MAQDIQDGFEMKPHERTLAIAIDCSRAYDRVWRPKLVNRMMEEGVPKCMIRWFKSFLEDRKAQVRLGQGKSKWMRLQQGLPQGAVSSPVLFLLYVNKWDNLQEERVEYSGFADDIAVWAKGTDLGDLRDRLERALRKIEKWAGDLKIQLNPSKTEACLFTNNLAERDHDPKLTLDGKVIQMKKQIKLLGVTLDQKLTFKTQTELVCQKMRKRARVLTALAGKDWGSSRKILTSIYKALVESVVWYGAAGWLPWLSKSNLKKLERSQRMDLKSSDRPP